MVKDINEAYNLIKKYTHRTQTTYIDDANTKQWKFKGQAYIFGIDDGIVDSCLHGIVKESGRYIAIPFLAWFDLLDDDNITILDQENKKKLGIKD